MLTVMVARGPVFVLFLVVIKFHARLATSLRNEDNSDNTTDSPAALAAVGKRTLFVEPVHMAYDATF